MPSFHLSRRATARALAGLALLAMLAWGWQRLSQPWGVQSVDFRPAQQQCHQQGRLHYCVHRAPGGVNGDVLYHLHGRNLEAEVWNDPSYYTALLQRHWQQAGAVPPTVVSLSYGPVWLLSPQGSAPDSGLLARVGPDIAAVEARIGTPKRRLLMGESMGGLNSLLLGLSQPQRFDKIAALCPNVYQSSPFAPWREIRDALVRTGADPRVALGHWWLARRHVSTPDEWQRMAPLALIDGAALRDASPALYLSAGLYDRHGLYEGTERLAQRAAQRGLPTEWRPLYGGHCAIDIASLGAFLLR